MNKNITKSLNIARDILSKIFEYTNVKLMATMTLDGALGERSVIFLAISSSFFLLLSSSLDFCALFIDTKIMLPRRHAIACISIKSVETAS